MALTEQSAGTPKRGCPAKAKSRRQYLLGAPKRLHHRRHRGSKRILRSRLQWGGRWLLTRPKNLISLQLIPIPTFRRQRMTPIDF